MVRTKTMIRDPEFNSAWYRTQHPDLALIGKTPLEHYLAIGERVRRSNATSAWQSEHSDAVLSSAPNAPLDELANAAAVPLALNGCCACIMARSKCRHRFALPLDCLTNLASGSLTAMFTQSRPKISTFIPAIAQLSKAREAEYTNGSGEGAGTSTPALSCRFTTSSSIR